MRMNHLDLGDKDRQRILESALNAVQEGILLLGQDLNVLMTNRWLEQRFISKMPMVGRKCYAVFRDAQEPCPECPYVRSLATGEPQTQVFECLSDRHPAAWFEVSVHLCDDGDGRTTGALGLVRDITEPRRTEELLKDEISRRRILVDQSRDGIVVLDQNGKVYEANQSFARMLGYSMEEVRRLHLWDWDTQFGREELLGMVDAVDDSGAQIETRHHRKDGTLCEVEISTNGAVFGGEKFVFCVCRDVSEKKAMEQRIRDMAIRDPLTNVYNRRYLFERLSEIAAEHDRHGKGFCVSILDIDHFKAVNDTYGHQAGDFALQEFAYTVSSVIRQYDLLGRYGGEEFIILSPSAGGAETAAMIERLMQAMRAKVVLFEGRRIRFTFSCGIAASSEFLRGALSTNAMIALADKRLYLAKENGRDCCVGPLPIPRPLGR
jgi:diguanylate cyclase (GGDEF)-like protein/PAS domain S-box-containing protein